MITEIGTSRQEQDGHFEVRAFDGEGEHVATFRESVLQKVEVNEGLQHVPYCKARVVIDDADCSGFIRAGRLVEVWAARGDEPMSLLVRALVDFVDVRTGREAEEGAAVIEFEGRSPVSSCMDAPLRLDGSGSLTDLVTAILTPHGIHHSIDLDDEHIDYYVDVASGYAALRLLCLTFGAIVLTSREGRISITDISKAREQLNKKPVRTFKAGEILGMHTQQGQPIRKRRES